MMKENIYSLSQFTSNKIKILSFVGILALLFVHNTNGINIQLTPSMIVRQHFNWMDVVENFIANGLLRFRMPFMMAISGFFMFYKSKYSYIALLKKKLSTIVIPFLIIVAIGLLLTALLENFAVPRISDIGFHGLLGKKVTEFGFMDFIRFMLITPVSFQLWYLKVLLVFLLLYPVIKLCFRHFPILFLVSVFVLWFFTFYIGGKETDRGYFFFLAGAYLAYAKVEIDKPFKFFSPRLSLHLFLMILVLKTGITFYGYDIIGNNAKYLVSTLYKMNEILGLYAFWFVFDKALLKVIDHSFLLKISASSFFIYAFHAPLIGYVNQIFALSNNGFSNNPLFAFFFIPIIILIITLLAEDFIKSISPKFYTVLTGGRGNIKNGTLFLHYFNLTENLFSRKLVFKGIAVAEFTFFAMFVIQHTGLNIL